MKRYFYSNDGIVALTIESLGDHKYRAINKFTDITARIIPINDNGASLECIEHKRTDKLGRRRTSKRLLESNLKWLWYMLQKYDLFERN